MATAEGRCSGHRGSPSESIQADRQTRVTAGAGGDLTHIGRGLHAVRRIESLAAFSVAKRSSACDQALERGVSAPVRCGIVRALIDHASVGERA